MTKIVDSERDGACPVSTWVFEKEHYAARRLLERPEAPRLDDDLPADAACLRPVLREAREPVFPELRLFLWLVALERVLLDERPAP